MTAACYLNYDSQHTTKLVDFWKLSLNMQRKHILSKLALRRQFSSCTTFYSDNIQALPERKSNLKHQKEMSSNVCFQTKPKKLGPTDNLLHCKLEKHIFC